MVLPASIADDPVRADARWIEKVRSGLRLSRGAILLQVDGAGPERLGELVRELLQDHADLDVIAGVPSLETVPAGSTIVLVPRPEDASWLNLNRPIFSRRNIKAVLWCRREASIALAQQAPDIFDWISQRVECPPGPVRHAVETIRAAVACEAPGLVWRGVEEEEGEAPARLEATFAAALPGERLAWIAAERDHERLLEAVSAAGEAWIACSIESLTAMRRFRWALAEVGRRGRAIAVAPKVPCPGWWRVDDRQSSLEDACSRLAGAGASRPGRLAALLDLEPHAIQDAVERLRAGATPEQVEEAARDRNPLRAVGLAAVGSTLLTSGGTTRGLRRAVPGPVAGPTDWERLEAELARGIRSARGWEAVALEAAVLGDASAAAAWARRAMEAARWRAPLLGRQTRRLAEHGDVDVLLRHHENFRHRWMPLAVLLVIGAAMLIWGVVLAPMQPGWLTLSIFGVLVVGQLLVLRLFLVENRAFDHSLRRIEERFRWMTTIERLFETEDWPRIHDQVEHVLSATEASQDAEHPFFRGLLLRAAIQRLLENQPRAAIRAITRAIALEGTIDGVDTPFFATAVMILAMAYSDMGVPRTAIVLLRKVIGKTPLDDLPPQPGDFEPTVALPFLEGEDGRLAERHLRRFLRRSGPVPLEVEMFDTAVEALSGALRKQGRHEEADLVCPEPPRSGPRGR